MACILLRVRQEHTNGNVDQCLPHLLKDVEHAIFAWVRGPGPVLAEVVSEAIDDALGRHVDMHARRRLKSQEAVLVEFLEAAWKRYKVELISIGEKIFVHSIAEHTHHNAECIYLAAKIETVSACCRATSRRANWDAH